MRHQFAVLRVEVGAPVGRAIHVFFDGARFFVAAVHFAFQAFEFGEGDVGGAAFDFGFFHQFAAGVKFCRFERHAAFGGKRGGEDVGGVVQVVLCVAADEFFVFGEGNVAFEDACAFTRASEVGIAGVLGELERGATVANGKFGFFRRLLRTGEQLLFEGAVFEVVNEVERAHAVGERLGFCLGVCGNGGKDGKDEGAFHVVLLCVKFTVILHPFSPIFREIRNFPQLFTIAGDCINKGEALRLPLVWRMQRFISPGVPVQGFLPCVWLLPA